MALMYFFLERGAKKEPNKHSQKQKKKHILLDKKKSFPEGFNEMNVIITEDIISLLFGSWERPFQLVLP